MEKCLTHLEREKRWSFTLTVTFIEILNDEIKDLLTLVNMKESRKNTKRRTLKPLRIMGDSRGKTYVSDATEVTFDTNNSKNGLAQLQEIISAVRANWAVAHTVKNNSSSRSRAVFRLSISRRQEDIKQSIDRVLYIRDLASTEEENFQDKECSRQKTSINQHLHELRNVLLKLANKEHVPTYRSSKLTHMLQDCLCVGARVMMIFILSPAPKSWKQSMYTLDQQVSVAKVQLGKANKDVQSWI